MAISYSVRIAFASNPFDVTPTWVDVTADMMGFHIRRGRQWELNRMEPGTCTLRLRNLHGNYWPTNTTGSYYPNVLPWKRINIQASFPTVTTTYDLYTGYIEAWQPDFVIKPIKAPVMDLTCSDGIKNLSLFTLTSTTAYASELSGTRIANVLDSVSWPTSTRLIDAGQSYLQSTGAMTDVNAMTHLYTVEDTELGILYMTPSGSMRFEDRHARLLSPYTVSQATFGDLPSTDKPYSGILLAHEDLRVYNDLRVTSLNGLEQRSTNTTSADTYGPRALLRPSLLMVTDAEALAQGQYLLQRYQTPVIRAKQIEIKPSYDPTNLYPIVLGFDISTRVTIKLSQASLNKDYHIEGINHDFEVIDPGGLVTTWMLSDAANQGSWILDDTIQSVLGSTTILAY